MREQLNSISRIKSLDQSIFPNIVGKLQIKPHNYLIVTLDSCQENSTEITVTPSITSPSFAEIGRFEVNGQLFAIMEAKNGSTIAGLDLATLLTERELQIATLIAWGQSNKQIASRLQISEWTVSTHLRRSFSKLGVDSRAAMVYRCASLIR